MAATTTLLGLVTPTQGTLSGTWGDTVNYGISDYVDIAIAGTLSFTGDGAVTLANTTGSASGNAITTTTAQYAMIKVTGTLTTTKIITAPSYSKTYIVINDATGGSVTIKAAGQSGVTIAVGDKALVAFNGTDYVRVGASAGGSDTQVQFNSSGNLAGSANLTFNGTALTANTLTPTNALGAAYGGTGLTSTTAYSVVFSGTTGTGAFQAAAGPGTATHVLTSNGAGALPTFQALPASGLSRAQVTSIAMLYSI